MIKVDEVYPIDINTTIGPTGTIKRLFRNRDFFAERGYELSIIANIPVGKRVLTYKYEMQELISLPGEKGNSIITDSINALGRINSLKSKIKSFIESNRCMSAIYFKRGSIMNKKLIAQYISMGRNPDIIVFHETDSCYHYYKMLNTENHFISVSVVSER